MKRKQPGFTLIEIAIVMVIIGLLLSGVLKGQELINSAKVKNLAGDFRNIQVFIYAYQDKFKALPGDDAAAITHVTASKNGDGNGVIDGKWNDVAADSEAFNFWQHVRLAGLAPGPTDKNDADYLPKNASGGAIGVSNAASTAIIGLKGSSIICSNAIAGKFARQLDSILDDGNTATGSMMVTAAGTAAGGSAIATGNIVDDTPYLVCMGI